MPRYNHMFTIAFTLVNDDPHGYNITPAQFREALDKRMADLDANGEWEEAIGAPHDSYVEDEA